MNLLLARGGDGAIAPPVRQSRAAAAPAPALFLQLLRLLASLMLGVAIFTLISGGVSWVSSIAVIAQAVCLLRLARSTPALDAALYNNADHGGDDCDCTGSPLRTLRALSILGMTIAIFELLAGVTLLSLYGALFLDESSLFPGYYLGYCPALGLSCYSSPSFSSYPRLGTSGWALYAAGNTAVSSVLNIAWCVTVFRVVQLHRRSALSSGEPKPGGPNERLPLISAAGIGDRTYAARSDASNYIPLRHTPPAKGSSLPTPPPLAPSGVY